MSRPTSVKVDGTVYWTLMTYDADGILVDADSTPTVAVRKNGASVADAVTVTKRAATTGIYDCSHNPAGEAEGDCFGYEESVTISSQAYLNPWSLEVEAAERGTDGANTVAPVDVSSDVTAVKAITDKLDTMLESDTSDILSGFESGFDGWAAVAYFGGNASHTTVSTAEARTGSQSIRMVNDSDNGSNDRVGIVRTETFGNGATVSGYLYSTNSFASSDERVEFWVDGAFSASKTPTAGQTWEAFSFNVPTGSHDIALVRYSDENANAANVHLDDITLTGVASSEYQYTAGSLDQAPSSGGGDATAANQTQLIADIAALNDFNPATDPVANVTLVATTTTNSDMRGTDGANTVAPVDVSSDVTAILADTNELQLNQNNWLTATGFSTFDASTDTVTTDTASRDASKADVSGLSTFDASTDQVVASNMRGTDGANTVTPNTVAPDNASIAAILLDTADLQANQGQWLTANVSGLASQASVDVLDSNVDTLVANQGDWATADVSGLLTASGYSSSLPANFSTLIVGTGADLGKVTPSNPAAGSGSSHTAQDVADLILVTPANKLATDASGDVTANNMRGTDGANTVAPVDVSSSVALILADTSDLQANQNNWLTATTTVSSNMRGTDNANTVTPVDVSGAIAALNDFNPAVDTVARVTLVDTTTDLTNGGSGGGTNPADIYTYFTDGTREDAFKADTSGLSTFDPASDTVARVTLVDTTTDLTNQTSGGVGMFQASVRVQDSSGNALQGARINVDGTTLSLTTGVSGEVVFNLDSGVYLLNLLPPADYDTPTGQVLTITSSDPSQTVFTLTSTSPPSGCDVPWIG